MGNHEAKMTIVLFLIVGIAAGFLATRIMGLNTDPLTTIAIGVAGARGRFCFADFGDGFGVDGRLRWGGSWRHPFDLALENLSPLGKRL
jgi:uncharacterized membrane protein YeaQ/YmgE (transglycosylase-associated protein family)